MYRALFLVATLCCSAAAARAAEPACDAEQLIDDLQVEIQNNGQHCASHDAFEDLTNGACHRDANLLNQGFTNCQPYDGSSGLDNWNGCPLNVRMNLTFKIAVASRVFKPSDCGIPLSTRRHKR